MGKYTRLLWQCLLGTCLLVLALCISSTAYAQQVTQTYGSDTALQKGMIVRLKPGDGSKVEALGQKDASEMFGVVVSAADAAVSLSNPEAGRQVYVATGGQYDVLVSTQNGAIEQGDYITISSLSGVGMRAENTQEFALGRALTGFDEKSNIEGTTQLETNKRKMNVSLGRIRIEVSVAHNPLYENQKAAAVPNFLSKAAHLVTGRQVSALRIYTGAGVLLLSLVIASSILYAGVRSGMTAVGRNPLAKRSIMRNLVQVTLMSLIIFAIGLFAVYLLLRI